MFKRISLVIQREYLSRVKKKSFLLMTFLTPILIAFFYGLVIYIVMNPGKPEKLKTIAVVDPSRALHGRLHNNNHLSLVEDSNSILSATTFAQLGYDACLELPDPTLTQKYEPTLTTRETFSIADAGYLEKMLQDGLFQYHLERMHINPDTLAAANVEVNLQTAKVDEHGTREASTGIVTGLGIGFSVLIYFFIFTYGAQVMRGVMEEKTNRIVEIIISSVKPFELMMGKILGIALVAFTQMALWVILSTVATGFVSQAMGTMTPEVTKAGGMMAGGSTASTFNMLFHSVNWPLLAFTFIFFFLFGYLFYAALFAAIGSAVDSETELQQFTLPVTMPLVFTFILTLSLIQSDPQGKILFWLSLLPFSAPVTMMARIPFMDPSDYWQIGLSMMMMVLSFVGTVWVAARIYRTGILMYGKKASWKEVFKWLFYKG